MDRWLIAHAGESENFEDGVGETLIFDPEQQRN
jgi:hypothetical protein